MTPKLQRRLDSLERSKAALLASLSGWTPEQLAFRPAPDTWSAAEILDHIARTEDGILHAVRGNLHAPKPLGKRDRLTSFVVRCILRSPLKLTVSPQTRMADADPAVDPGESIAAWEDARTRWCKLVTTATPRQIEGGVFNPPRGGWMSLADTLLFLRLHHDHYLAQIDRLQKALPA